MSASKGSAYTAPTCKGKNSAAKASAEAPAAKDVAPDPRHRLVLGLKFDGSEAFDYFRPSLIRFAATLAMVEAAPASSPVR